MDKCSICGNTNLTITKKNYQFVESGLDNVMLAGANVTECSNCGEEFVSVPNAAKLMDSIAELIILKTGSLTGQEIRFLRKNLFMTIEEFATLLGVTRVSLSRWENEQVKPAVNNDRLIRLTYATCKKISETTRKKLIKRFKDESLEGTVPERYFISACARRSRGQ